MNTKLFLLLAFLLTTNQTSSVVMKHKVHIPSAVVENASTSLSLAEENSTEIDQMIPELVPDAGTKHAEKGPKEHEDGKHHHFHFSRVPVSRRRNLIVIAGKFALAILHICVFIYCFMHAFH